MFPGELAQLLQTVELAARSCRRLVIERAATEKGLDVGLQPINWRVKRLSCAGFVSKLEQLVDPWAFTVHEHHKRQTGPPVFYLGIEHFSIKTTQPPPEPPLTTFNLAAAK